MLESNIAKALKMLEEAPALATQLKPDSKGVDRERKEEEEIVSEVIRRMPPQWQSAWREMEHTEGEGSCTERRRRLQQLVSKMTLRCERCQGRN